MKRENLQRFRINGPLFLIIAALLLMTAGCATSGEKSAKQTVAAESSQISLKQPMEIPENATCGKCGMYPAKYPRWQSQIIFNDDTMTPFDGCKCMFNFLFAMDKFDQSHSRDDVAVLWVRDFNSSDWIDAGEAYYVVGSDMMGPMGKELIPFADKDAAMKFQQEQGGTVMMYSEINPEVLGSLGMGNMKKHMKM